MSHGLRAFTLILIGLTALPHTHAQDVVPEELPNGYYAVGPDKVATLNRLCTATAATGLFSGAVLVAEHGKVIYKQGFGLANREWGIPNSTDTKFRLASVSKQFCSMLILQLVQENKLRLDGVITDYLPNYRRDTGEKITIHHLLCHQSGIKDFTTSFDYRNSIARSSFDKDEFIKAHCSGELLYEPGTIYSYCNAGYCILGRIIERVTNKSFERNLSDRIFKPLGMKNSGYDRNRYLLEKRASGYTYGPFGLENAEFIEMDSTPGAAGALYSTVDDMFLWDRALYTDKLLNTRFRELMFTPNRDVPEVKAAGGRTQSVYGYGWQIYSRTHPVTKQRTQIVNHGGAINGFRAMESRLIEDDAFVILLCNQGDAIGETQVWNAIVRLNTELIHVVTNQPFRMPSKPRATQDQRMYQLVRSEGVDAALDWFNEKGKQAAWGGSFVLLAQKLIDEGHVAEGLRLLEADTELTPNKIWLVRKTCRAFLENGSPDKALKYARRGLELRPDDERFSALLSQAQSAIDSQSSIPAGKL